MRNELTLQSWIDRTDVENPQITATLSVDNRPLVDFEARALGVDLIALRQSQEHDGEYFIVTCACGDALCAGIRQGVQVRHDSQSVHWVFRDKSDTHVYRFETQAYRNAVQKGILQLHKLVAASPTVELVPTVKIYFQQVQRESTLETTPKCKR